MGGRHRLADGRGHPNVAETVSGAVVAVVSVVTYIITEGKIDAAAVGDAAQKVQDAVDAVTGQED